MKTPDQYHLQLRISVIVAIVLMFGQQSTAQSYFNINFTNSSNKYSLITEVKTITFDGSGGIVIKKTDNSITTETLNLIKNITLDGSSGGGAALPVELVSFTATISSGNTKLNWTTATEVNNHGFEVERSTVSSFMSHVSGGNISNVKPETPHSGWTRIAFVEGAGTSNILREYSYTDRSISAGTYSYRLKQIDRDGKFEFSNEVEVTVAGSPETFVLEQNYPNPFNPTTSIKFQLSVNGMTSLIVYDVLGREIAVLVNGYTEAGIYSATFDASSFSSGIFIAKLQSGEKTLIRKMILMK